MEHEGKNMRAGRNKQSKSTVTIATLILSGLFAGIIVGPIFLYGQEPETPREQETPSYIETPDTEGPSNYPPGSDSQYLPGTDAPAFGPGDYTIGAGGSAIPDPSAAVARQAAAAAAAQKAREDQAAEMAKAFSCIGGGWTSPLSFNLKGCVANLMDMVMWIAARTLWIAGVLLNMTLHLTLNLNTLLEQLPIVDIGWKVLRDIANIVFIFITLWAGISITLGIGDGGKKAWGLLAQMVLVALFINFSLFITKAIVDASNIAALHFYSLIVEPGKEKDYDSGLSEAFMYGLKLSTLYNAKQIGSGAINADASMIATAARSSNLNGGLSFTNIILIGFFGSLFIVVAAWVFFAAAIMFIYRAITLIFLMLLSPLAFVGLILPGASGMAHQWWSKLWSQAFFAPLYLALAYVVVRTINGSTFQAFQGTLPGSTPGTGFAAALTTTSFGPVSVIFNFVILIGLMVGCLIVAQSLGAKGSEMAMAGWQKIKGAVVGGAIGVAGATARGIIKAPSAAVQGAGNIGKAAQWMSTTKLLNNKLLNFKNTKMAQRMDAFGARFQEGKGIGGKLGKYARKTGEWLDPRYLEERASQSKFGNTMIGRAVRSVTTGAVANVKIGDKSLQEAYGEGEEMASKRREIEYGHTARSNAKDLEPLQKDEQQKLNEKLAAEEELRATEKRLEDAKDGGNATEIAKEEAALGKGFVDARKEHAVAETELEKAKKSKDPTKIAVAEAAVAAVKAKMDAESKKGGAAVAAAKAEEAVEAFEKANRETMEAYTSRIQDALGIMSTEAFLNLPKTFFENPAFMDHTALGQDKFAALMKSEHFTKQEKEEYTKARWKRAEETAERRKARNDRYLAELPEYQKKKEAYEAGVKKIEESSGVGLTDTFAKEYEKEMGELNKQLAKFTDEVAQMEELVDKGKADPAALEWSKEKLGNVKTQINTRQEDKKDRIAEREKEIKKAGLVAPVMQSQPPGWDEATDIRKALRNILRTDEVTALYRYNRKAFGNPFIADTIKQGTWNLVRNTGEIDSNSMEQARVIKRHYLKDSMYLGGGLDAAQMHEFEEQSRTGAYALLDELGEKMKELGIEGYREFIKGGELQQLLKERGLANLSADVDVQLHRHDAGQSMYRETAQNLATNEFEMMPGMMREHPMSLNYYDQSSITPFVHRDIENTLPIAEFYIEQFKRHVEGTGRISEGNLRILKWFVNENQGQGFTQFEMIRDDLKDWFEMIKRLIGKSNRAMTTRKYVTDEDVYADMDRKVGRHLDPFDLIRSDKDKPR